MATVGIIVVSYCVDPRPLFASIASGRHQVRWYLFFHGRDKALKAMLDAFAEADGVRYFPYGVNRGLARSWNDGLLASVGDGNDVTIIVNDDLFFYPAAFDQFIDFVLQQKSRVPGFGLITLRGKETGGPAAVGSGIFHQKTRIQDAACMAVGEAALAQVGYFDQNFWPAYWEDVDYFYRLKLRGVPILCDDRTLVEHKRSAVNRKDRIIALLADDRWRRNQAYYMRKWGGDLGVETFVAPFDDDTLDGFIGAENRATPFGPRYDRTDLGIAATAGLLEQCVAEEIFEIVQRRGAPCRRYLEWSGGDCTAIMAEYAKSQDAEFFLSIDDEAPRLRQTMAGIPKYHFLHCRFIDCREAAGETAELSDKGNAVTDYIAYPLGLGVKFDMIVIAGRWRMECALAAAMMLAPEGLVVLVDQERRRQRTIRRLFDAARLPAAAGGVAVLDQWRRNRDGALHALYEPIEEREQFLVLRAKPQPAPARRRGETA
jgi:hypothetical protein